MFVVVYVFDWVLVCFDCDMDDWVVVDLVVFFVGEDWFLVGGGGVCVN